MGGHPAHLNLVVGWLWIAVGFLFGLFEGSFFHSDEWLGGYTSLKRRLYRLAHISFFGLAIMNLLFYFTAPLFPYASRSAEIASWAFAVGALTMPPSCLLMAHYPRLRGVFAVPVISLITAGSLTFWEVLRI